MEASTEFVENWNILQTLGEGAYGEVKLLVHQVTNHPIAVKIVDLQKHRDAAECVNKEEKIHRLLVHPNVIRLLGKREEANKVYIFLEYASGGELFDRIEPDVGMNSGEAQKYMKQLLHGVSYLHSKGIVHRDIKPENLLLNDEGNLKISDFGMATVYRLKGRERILDKRCGTLPYVAPEVLHKTYRAEPIDIWSCGIVLVAMLAGELPWDEPSDKCMEYCKWKNEQYLMSTPWSKLENSVLSLAKKILCSVPQNRPTIAQILQHPWMQKEFNIEVLKEKNTNSISEPDFPTVALSQPAPIPISAPEDLTLLLQKSVKKPICFSQPTQNEDLILGSQLQLTQSPLTQNNMQQLMRRMTRFFVKTDFEKTVKILCWHLDKLHYAHNKEMCALVTISTVDCRKMPLIFKANLIEMDGKLLLDFRLSKGCGIEFKRKFMKLKNALQEIIIKT